MNVYQVVGTVVQAWGFALRCLQFGRVREPFFVLAGLQLGVLILLGQFHAEWFAGALTPVVRALGGEAATHYPEHFWLLPELYRNANAGLMILFGVFIHAAAIAGFASRSNRWSPAFRRAGALIPIGFLHFGIAWAITSAFNLVPEEIVFYSSIIRLGLQGVELGLILILSSLLAYAPVLVVLDDASFPRALAGSVRLCLRMPLQTLLVVAVPVALMFPPTFFLYEMNLDMAGLAPETVGLLLIAIVVVRVCFDVVVVGGLTCLYLSFGRSER